MARIREDTPFGSDSFLDVVANVVGILIILIIVVGVRVSRSPVAIEDRETASAAAESVVEAPAAAPAPPAPPPVVALSPEPRAPDWPAVADPPPPPPPPRVVVIEKPLPALPAPAPPAELLAQHRELEHGIARTEAARKSADLELARLAERDAALRRVLSDAQRTAADERARAERVRSEIDAARGELAETVEQLARLQELLNESQQAPAVTTIEHRINPLGKAVSGRELHFYLSRGMVAPVPVDELSSRLKLQIERQKELLARMDRYEGDVDPIDGFRMKYVVEKSRLSLADELRFGSNLVRMQVTQWMLLPEPGLRMESPDEAVRRGSLFYQALLTAGPTTTLTFWVYPDSFAACARLKQFVHQHGYEVAARPLPEGIPIAGSPDGSKSVAQ